MFSPGTAKDPLGQAIFDRPVRIQSMNPTVQAKAKVVAQRLGHERLNTRLG
jgi:hypothetical protein